MPARRAMHTRLACERHRYTAGIAAERVNVTDDEKQSAVPWRERPLARIGAVSREPVTVGC